MNQAMLSNRINRVKPSPSIAAKALVDRLRAEGRDIIDFTIGEPDLPTPAYIVDAAIKALDRGETKYTASSGIAPLRQAIADSLRRDSSLEYRPENVVVGGGGKHVLFNALTVTLNPGDEVIIPAPFWVSYPDMVALNDGVPVIVTCEEADGFKLQPEALEAAITPKTKWLFLNTPNNPTGVVYAREELERIGAVLERHPHVWLLSDEIYEHFVFGGRTHVSPIAAIPCVAERHLLVSGVSKGYAMTGWRIGYGAGPRPLIDAIGKLITQSTTCPSSISQAAAVAAFAGPRPDEISRIFAERAELVAFLLRDAKGITVSVPQGAFYLFPSVRDLIGKKTPDGKAIRTDLDVVQYLVEHAGVATLDGTAYGLSPYLRLSFATSNDAIVEGCNRIVRACADLR
ncbi:Aspartate/prephenate aminotransferase [Paraburkholderia rhynchosiae]|uniref:Aminotransferase n=2 Tax=Paraburkholderia rhynchosiae TaxID=487049 RepID=A0A2N7W470_9BURK|nr:aspartate aminotransferase [Paraburkholderia rhynchosiae]CAB3737388.1 Aspartate/prephenate aminotransferase [Paraburkholderia rhynchosiae]